MQSKIRFVTMLALIGFFSVNCTLHLTPEKFEVNPGLVQKFSSDIPIQVMVPENADKEYPIKCTRWGVTIYADLNDLYKNAEELIKEVLENNRVPVSTDSSKHLRFSIDKIQWEQWAMGFSMGAYLDFSVETSGGYKRNYRVQDGSAWHAERAINGTISRAVEKIFLDREVIKFIEASTTKQTTFIPSGGNVKQDGASQKFSNPKKVTEDGSKVWEIVGKGMDMDFYQDEAEGRPVLGKDIAVGDSFTIQGKEFKLLKNSGWVTYYNEYRSVYEINPPSMKPLGIRAPKDELVIITVFKLTQK